MPANSQPDEEGLDILSTESTDEADSRPTPKQRSRVKRPLLIIVGVLVVCLLIPVAVVAAYLSRVESAFNSNVKRDPSLTLPSSSTRPAPPAQDEPGAGSMNFLVMGSDDLGNGAGGRSDALMLIHLSAKKDSAYIISFPRDLYVDIPRFGKNKINAAFAFGGPALAVETVEQLMNIRIDHVAQIGMTGFINLTTELGGVTLNNPHYSVSSGYEFPVGQITISGEQALAYVRERKQLPRGDLDRAERQRLVVQAIIRKALSREVITDPNKFTNFVAAFARNMSVDSELTDSKVRELALAMRITSSNAVVALEVPTNGVGWAGPQSIVIADMDGIAKLATLVREDRMSEYKP